MRCLVFNGWAAGPETWSLCTFPHDWVFDYVEQLDALPEKVMEESDEVVLVGFSMGGSTALRMWLKHPEKVKGLVLVSTTPRMMEEKGVGEGVGVGGESIVIVSDWGEGGTATVRPDRAALGLPDGFKAFDFETGAELKVKDGAVDVTLGKHDFAIIRMTR